MKICFLVTLYDVIGGVETLIYRMSKWLGQNGHQVTILSNKIISPLDNIHGKIIIEKQFNLLDDIWRAKLFLNKYKSLDVDFVKTFHVYDARKAAALACIMQRPVKVACGVYTPKQLDPKVMGWETIDTYLKITNKYSRWLCFADSLLELEQLDVEEKYKQYQYFPLPVGNMNILWTRKPQWGKLVSIGRIAEMKTYNFLMVDIVNKLKGEGYNIEYHIYGDGEMKDQLESYICEKDIHRCVFFHGTLPYELFNSVLTDAYIFIGMGTALIEAAQNGIPSLVCIPYDKDAKTYGRFSCFPFDLQKQALLFKTDKLPSLKEEIVKLLKAEKQEYEEESKRCRANAMLWSENYCMNRFLGIIESMPQKTINSLYLQYSRIIRCIKNNLSRMHKVILR